MIEMLKAVVIILIALYLAILCVIGIIAVSYIVLNMYPDRVIQNTIIINIPTILIIIYNLLSWVKR